MDIKGPKNLSIWKFILTYIVLMGLFLLLIGLESIKTVLDINGIYTSMIVYLSALVLDPFNIVQGVNGSVITLKGMALEVPFGCNGLEAFLIYTVAILSFPATMVKKIIGIVGGFVILQIFNLLRIAGLGLSAVQLFFQCPSYFFFSGCPVLSIQMAETVACGSRPYSISRSSPLHIFLLLP